MKKIIIVITLMSFSFQNPVLLLAEVPPLSPEEFALTTPTKAFNPDEVPPQNQAAVPASISPFESQSWTPWGTPLSTVSGSDKNWQETSLVTGHSYYVSASGSEAGDGTEANPWRSVQKAVDALQPGDVLVISEGVYHETVNLKTSGRSDAFITIRGRGNVVFDGGADLVKMPAFDTQGFDYLRFENLSVKNMRAAVEVASGSDQVVIDGLKTEGNRFGVRIHNSTNITVRNANVTKSKNGFRAYGASRNLLFENISVSESRDIYEGMSETYLNGDGFIFELEVSNVTLRNIVSFNHWDAGFDVKASNVLMENVVAYGNKNNWKIWGKNVVIRNSLSFGAKRQIRPNGSYVEGNGITMEIGASAKLVNVTLADNEHRDIQLYTDSTLIVENSIVSRVANTGLLLNNGGGVFSSNNVMWFNSAALKPINEMSSSDSWMDPQFANRANRDYQISALSPALDRSLPGSDLGAFDLLSNERVSGEWADLGAYEFRGSLSLNPIPAFGPGHILPVIPAPNPQPDVKPGPAPDPVPTPMPTEGYLWGVAEEQTVSGFIFLQLNPERMKNVRSVTYFIDGKKVAGTAKAPFALGSTKGYDSKKLKDGAHVITAHIRTKSGEEVSTLNFKTKNSK